jgi:hypothetical protein
MPRPRKSVQNESFLSAALEGLQMQKQRIEDQIREVRALLGKRRPGRPAGKVSSKRGPRKLSAEARRKIAAAQRRRWAKYRKSSAGKAE